MYCKFATVYCLRNTDHILLKPTMDIWTCDIWTCDGDVSLATLGLKKWQMVEYVRNSMNIRPYLSLRVRACISRHEEEKNARKKYHM